VWGQTEIGQSNYVLLHVFATTDTTTPLFCIMGQAEYTTAANAEAGATTELLSIQSALPLVEFKALGSVIWQTSTAYSNAVKARTRSTSTGGQYEDWRTTSSVPLSTSVTPGSGTINTVAKWLTPSSLGNSTITDDGTTVTINTATQFNVNGISMGANPANTTTPIYITSSATTDNLIFLENRASSSRPGFGVFNGAGNVRMQLVNNGAGTTGLIAQYTALVWGLNMSGGLNVFTYDTSQLTLGTGNQAAITIAGTHGLITVVDNDLKITSADEVGTPRAVLFQAASLWGLDANNQEFRGLKASDDGLTRTPWIEAKSPGGGVAVSEIDLNTIVSSVATTQIKVNTSGVTIPGLATANTGIVYAAATTGLLAATNIAAGTIPMGSATTGLAGSIMQQVSGQILLGSTSSGSDSNALLDIQSSNSNGVIASFGNTTSVHAGYPAYIYFSYTNAINSGYNINGSAGLWINYTGYQNGTTQPRFLIVGDCKKNPLLTIDPTATPNVKVSTDFQATGDIYTVAYTTYSSTTTGFTSSPQTIRYVKVGHMVTVFLDISSAGNNASVTFTLPYTCNAGQAVYAMAIIDISSLYIPGFVSVADGSSSLGVYQIGSGIYNLTTPYATSAGVIVKAQLTYYTSS
jgi:hypothetical protein